MFFFSFSGLTCVSLCAGSDDPALLSLLLDAGADPNVADNGNDLIREEEEEEDVSKEKKKEKEEGSGQFQWKQFGEGVTPLMRAVIGGRMENARILLEKVTVVYSIVLYLPSTCVQFLDQKINSRCVWNFRVPL